MPDAMSEGSSPVGALVIGPESRDRTWIEGTLLRGGLSVAVTSEAEVLATPELPGLHLLVLDDATDREARGATLRRLSAHPALKGVPILVLSYDADIESFTEALTRGVSAYLVKPVSAQELIDVARRLSGWSASSDRTERRHRLRRPLIMKVEVEAKHRQIRMTGQIVDVSGTGCRVETSEPLQVGESVKVILQAHEGSTHVALGAEVRWQRASAEGVPLAGLRFTGTTALLAGKILGFVSSGAT
jgi:CheY-like chemotaxis protein